MRLSAPHLYSPCPGPLPARWGLSSAHSCAVQPHACEVVQGGARRGHAPEPLAPDDGAGSSTGVVFRLQGRMRRWVEAAGSSRGVRTKGAEADMRPLLTSCFSTDGHGISVVIGRLSAPLSPELIYSHASISLANRPPLKGAI